MTELFCDTILTNTTFSSHITTTIETNMLQVAANSSVACPAIACGRNRFFSAISLRISDRASLFILFKYLWISLMHCLGLGSARWRKKLRDTAQSLDSQALELPQLQYGKLQAAQSRGLLYGAISSMSCRGHLTNTPNCNASRCRIGRICICPSRCQRLHEQLEASCSVL